MEKAQQTKEQTQKVVQKLVELGTMESEIIYPALREVRKKPKNLVEKDIRLFEHEFTLEIPEITRFNLANIHILRNVIFSVRTLRFYSTLTHIFQTPKKYFFKRLRLFLKRAKSLDKGIWITDEISAEYFHWFTDALARLNALESTEDKEIESIKKLPVILPDFYKDKQYVTRSLEILGYKARYYNPRKRLQVTQLISCSHTAPTGNYNSKLINELRTKLIKPKDIEPERKIYISRAKANKRKLLNESAVIGLLQQYNYEIHTFEDYDFDRQLGIMAETKFLIGIHGAGLTNMLFMKTGAYILELRNEGDSHNNCYFSLASSLSHDYYYLTNKGDREDTNSVNITVDIDRLENVLKVMEVKQTKI
jgi:capsular polysaccharide biosynthesis protein